MNQITVTQVIDQITSNQTRESDWLVIRVDGRDYVVDNVAKSYDGVIGQHVILNTKPIAELL